MEKHILETIREILEEQETYCMDDIVEHLRRKNIMTTRREVRQIMIRIARKVYQKAIKGA